MTENIITRKTTNMIKIIKKDTVEITMATKVTITVDTDTHLGGTQIAQGGIQMVQVQEGTEVRAHKEVITTGEDHTAQVMTPCTNNS
jgi:hypothetical protein